MLVDVSLAAQSSVLRFTDPDKRNLPWKINIFAAAVKEYKITPPEKMEKEIECAAPYEEIVKENIEQDVLLERHPYDLEMIGGDCWPDHRHGKQRA